MVIFTLAKWLCMITQPHAGQVEQEGIVLQLISVIICRTTRTPITAPNATVIIAGMMVSRACECTNIHRDSALLNNNIIIRLHTFISSNEYMY